MRRGKQEARGGNRIKNPSLREAGNKRQEMRRVLMIGPSLIYVIEE